MWSGFEDLAASFLQLPVPANSDSWLDEIDACLLPMHPRHSRDAFSGLADPRQRQLPNHGLCPTNLESIELFEEFFTARGAKHLSEAHQPSIDLAFLDGEESSTASDHAMHEAQTASPSHASTTSTVVTSDPTPATQQRRSELGNLERLRARPARKLKKKAVSEWPPELLELSTKEFNRRAKELEIPKPDCLALRKLRRRMKSRVYSQTHRNKLRSMHQSDSCSDHELDDDEDAGKEVDSEVVGRAETETRLAEMSAAVFADMSSVQQLLKQITTFNDRRA